MEAAARIGRALCRAAYWHAGHCNWVGRSPRESVRPDLPIVPTVAALGPDLYGGTAGIALFLAELYTQTSSPALARTARGAIRQALTKSETLPPGAAASFYSGMVGIAYAATRVGLLLGDDALFGDGIAAARHAAAVTDGSQALDVVAGDAGAIAPLLWLAARGGGDVLERFARDLASRLAERATRREGVWCWDTTVASGKGIGPTPLCGFAHGASGMGLALIEMGARDGEPAWIEGGLAAFAYEDALFDAQAGNWPDLRELQPNMGVGRPERPSFMTAWCHGAPGIGLARLRAHVLLPEHRATLRAGIERALGATRAFLSALPSDFDASPCHGRAGLIELLLVAGEVFGETRLLDEAAAAWRPALRQGRRSLDWPCGVASGRNNPSLMLGYAGIGHALLRAGIAASVPSALVIDPTQC
jgi:lantibiotic modifying enzyme